MSSKKHCSSDKSNDKSDTLNDSQNYEKKVCFICGSYTKYVINIHEPRCGPNMIEVITEKFKMRPLNDDKFLCYSCNNWLINWHSMQKKNNDDSSHEDVHQSTSSTMSAAFGRETSGNKFNNIYFYRYYINYQYNNYY